MKHAMFLVLAACARPVTTAQYDDVARSIASSAAGDTAAMLDVIAIAQGSPPPGFALGDDGAIDGSRGAIAYSYLITCKDVGGTALGACGQASALANVTYEWSGSNALPAQLVREGQWTASGLQSVTGTIEGDAELVDDAMIGTTSYHFDATATYTAVTLDLAAQRATAGSIALDLAASTDASAFSVSADVTITAGTAAIVLDGAHDYTADLATGGVTSGESP